MKKTVLIFLLAIFTFAAGLVAGPRVLAWVSPPAPSATPTAAPTSTSANTPTATVTVTPTETATETGWILFAGGVPTSFYGTGFFSVGYMPTGTMEVMTEVEVWFQYVRCDGLWNLKRGNTVALSGNDRWTGDFYVTTSFLEDTWMIQALQDQDHVCEIQFAVRQVKP